MNQSDLADLSQRAWALLAAIPQETLVLVGIVAAVLFVFRLLRRRFWVFFYATFFSTLLHELTHFIVALVLNGRPVGLAIVPRRTLMGYQLGQVSAVNVRWYNGTAIALAPLSLIAGAIWLLLHHAPASGQTIALKAVYVYVIASLLEGGLPSSSDWRLALKFAPIPLALAVMAGGAWWLYRNGGVPTWISLPV